MVILGVDGLELLSSLDGRGGFVLLFIGVLFGVFAV